MKLCILIHAHKNLQQLNRLINRLNNENTIIYVNVDKKSSINVNEIDKNARLIKQRINIQWGKFSQVQAALVSIKEILQNSEQFDHLSFISGQDYPIKSIEEILRFYSTYTNNEFMEYIQLTNNHKLENSRYEYFYFNNSFLTNLTIRFMHKFNIKRSFVKNVVPFKGASWWTFSFDCIKYINDFVHNNKQFLRFFKTTHCPDEMFFHTIVMNSMYKNNVINNAYRYIDWSFNNGLTKNPKILTQTDYKKIISSDKHFARKLDADIDNQIFTLLDSRFTTV